MTVVLVNGVSGAGKSTLARALSRALGLPLFSRDVIKETHADMLGGVDGARLGAAAGETMWALVADAPCGAVLDAPFLGLREVVAAGLTRARAGRPVEIWCDVPLALARRRTVERAADRHPVHAEPRGDDRWAYWASVAEPLALGPVYRVDTTTAVDVAALAAWVRDSTGDEGGAGCA